MRRLAGEEEAVRVEERLIGRSLRLGRQCLAAEGLGHDAVFRGDPGGDDPDRLPVELLRVLGVAPVLLGPDLTGGPAVLEVHGHPRVAAFLQESHGEQESRCFAGGGLGATRVVAAHDAHVPVAVELHRQVVAEPRGSLLGLALAPGSHEEVDRGPADPVLHGIPLARRGLRRLGGPLPAEDGDVAAPRQLDVHRIVGSFEEVVALERPTEASRLYPDDGVDDGVEVLPALEDLERDRGLGQALRSPREGLLDDEAEEVAGSGRTVEVAAAEDPLQATQNLLDLGRGLGRLRLVTAREATFSDGHAVRSCLHSTTLAEAPTTRKARRCKDLWPFGPSGLADLTP